MRVNPDGIKFTDELERELLKREFEHRRSIWIAPRWRGASRRLAMLIIASTALAGTLVLTADTALGLLLFTIVLAAGVITEKTATPNHPENAS